MTTFWSRTLDRLKTEGWAQREESGASGLCLGQAIFRQCVRDSLTSWKLFDDLAKKAVDHAGVKGHWPDPVSRVVYWNDHSKRTFADVEQLLTELHEKALAQGGELV